MYEASAFLSRVSVQRTLIRCDASNTAIVQIPDDKVQKNRAGVECANNILDEAICPSDRLPAEGRDALLCESRRLGRVEEVLLPDLAAGLSQCDDQYLKDTREFGAAGRDLDEPLVQVSEDKG